MADQTEQHIPGRLFAAVIDELAEKTPDRKFCSMPKGPNVSDGFRDITVKEIAKAVNYTAWWIEKRLGRSDNFETLSYMAANDVRYLVFILASNKTGYKVSRDGCGVRMGYCAQLTHTGLASLLEELRRGIPVSFDGHGMLKVRVQPRKKAEGPGDQEQPSGPRDTGDSVLG